MMFLELILILGAVVIGCFGFVIQAQEMIDVSFKIGSDLEYVIAMVPTTDGVQAIAQKFCKERKEDFGITEDNLIACLVPVVDYLSQFISKEPDNPLLREENFSVSLKAAETEFNISMQPTTEAAVATALNFCQQHGSKFGILNSTFEEECVKPVEEYLMEAAETEAKARATKRTLLVEAVASRRAYADARRNAQQRWSCHVIDQLSYCVYHGSLCMNANSELVLLTDFSSPLLGEKEKEILTQRETEDSHNLLGPPPWHLPDLRKINPFSHYDIPYRSFFPKARYSSFSLWDSVKIEKGWSLVAAFDADNYNIYHYVNKLHTAFIARLYELEGLKDASLNSDSTDMLSRLLDDDSGFDAAYLLRPPPTDWQKNYGDLCLGKKTTFTYITNENRDEKLPVCFEHAIIPGAALYLAEGLTSSALFRELAAQIKGIRVPESERNLITVFGRTDRRRIANIKELCDAIQQLAPMFKVAVVDWDGTVGFQEQAMHMAKSKIMITTHGSVLNHNIFMEPGSVVIEMAAYQFHYPLDEQIVIHRGNYYFRYAETLKNTRHQQMKFGEDPFPKMSTRTCMTFAPCITARRDADIKVDLNRFSAIFSESLSFVT